MRSSFCVSSSLIEVMGTPVQRDTRPRCPPDRNHAGGGSSKVVFFREEHAGFALFAFFIRVEARLSNSWFAIAFSHTMDDELDPLWTSVNSSARSLAQLHARAASSLSRVALVRQETIRNIPARVRH